MATAEDFINTYRFRRVVDGRMGDELAEEEKLALTTCPNGATALDRATADSHHWKRCSRCKVEVFLEDALSQRTIKVFDVPDCGA